MPDWRPWWEGQRLLYWPARAAATGADDAAWLAALGRLAERTAPTADRRAVAQAVALIADPRVAGLAATLAADPDAEVARAGLPALALHTDDRLGTLVGLANCLADASEEPARRMGAARALGLLRDRGAAIALRGALGAGAPDGVRGAAAQALGMLGDPSDVARLERLLRDGAAGAQARVGAAAGLGLAARQALLRPAATLALRRALADAAALVPAARQTAVLALGRGVADGAAVERLAQLLRDDPDGGTRACAALAMGWVANDPAARRRAVDALVERFDAEDGAARAFPALGLALAGHRAARPRLESWMRSADAPGARGAAAIALGLLGDPAGVAALLAVAGGSGPALLRADAVEALALTGNPEVPSLLRRMAGDGPDVVRASACYGLGWIGDPGDGALVRAGLAAESPMVRLGAVMGVAAAGGAPARDALLAHARGERQVVVRGLAIVAAGLAVGPRPFALLADAPELTPFQAEP